MAPVGDGVTDSLGQGDQPVVLGLYLSWFPTLKQGQPEKNSTHSDWPPKFSKTSPVWNNVSKHWTVAKITTNTVFQERGMDGSEDTGKAPGKVGLGLALSPSLLWNGVWVLDLTLDEYISSLGHTMGEDSNYILCFLWALNPSWVHAY